VNAAAWRLTLAAAALMGLVAGGRSAFGLFVSPLNTASGMGLAALSLAAALGQLALGFVQPFLGALADRFGAARLILLGGLLLALTTAVPAFWPVPLAISLAVVASSVAGSAVGSNGLLLGEVNRAVPAARAGLAVGVVGAGASVGQLVLGPAMQWLIDHQGWTFALAAMALCSLLAWPLALPFLRRRPARPGGPTPDADPPAPAAPAVREVLRQWRFWRVALSFGVCGFHVAFLAVHMPGVIERCGLPPSLAGTWIAVAGAANIVGSIAIGLAMKRHDAAWLLVALYFVRALGIAALLASTVTPAVMLAFAVVMGASHMATLPPTAQLIARQHGVERMGALFGVVMMVHQTGSFAGIFLGGWAVERTGSDTLLWCVDIAMALVAAALAGPWARRGARSLWTARFKRA
jgi:MFS family permease